MDHTLRAGTELGQKGPDLRWPMQVSCSVETMAPEQDCPPGQIGHQITGQGGSSWTLEEDPSWEACSRTKARHSWSRVHFQKPRLADVQCGGSSAWSGAVAALNMMPGVTWVAGWHPTQGPLFPRGLGSTPHLLTAPGDHQVVEIPRMDSRVKYLHSIDFPFICEKSICFSWFSVFAF